MSPAEAAEAIVAGWRDLTPHNFRGQLPLVPGRAGEIVELILKHSDRVRGLLRSPRREDDRPVQDAGILLHPPTVGAVKHAEKWSSWAATW